MKWKILSLSLLTAVAINSTEAADFYAKRRQAQEEAPKLKVALAAKHPDLDTATHATNEAAVDDVHAKLGTHAAAGGGAPDSANHRVTALKATLGHNAAGAAHEANERAETAATAIQAGQPIHTGITNINALIGAIPGADIHAKIVAINNQLGTTGPSIDQRMGAIDVALGAVRANPAGPGLAAGNIEAKLNAILSRLKAGLRANGAVAVLKTDGTPVVNMAVKSGPGAAIDLALHIENVLTEVGW